MKSTDSFYNPSHLGSFLNGNWAEFSKENPNRRKGKTVKQETGRLGRLFKNACKDAGEEGVNKNMFILGDEKLRADDDLIKNIGTLSTEPVYPKKKIAEFFRTVHPDVDPKARKAKVESHLQRGAILNESQWYILPNDVAVHGAIEGEKDCYVVPKNGEVPEEDELWDKKEQRPRVLGRELIQLYHAGYRVVKETIDGTFKNQGVLLYRLPSESESHPTLMDLRDAAKSATRNKVKNVFGDAVPLSEFTSSAEAGEV